MEIKETKDQPTISLRFNTNRNNMFKDIGDAYNKLMKFIGDSKIKSGPPFAIYHNEDTSNLDVEVGFFIDEAVPVKDNIMISKLPAGKNAYAVHTGSYDKIVNTRSQLKQWVKDNGYTTTGVSYDIYIDNPNEIDESKLRTEIYFSIK
jgi:effector-binding domain-containing protein